MDDLKTDVPGVKSVPVLEDRGYDTRQAQYDESNRYDPAYDKRDMRRLGRVQEVKRRFRIFSIIGYTVILALTWEGALVTSVFSLSSGGPGAAIWLTIISSAGQLLSTLSMAKNMASMVPTAGGQYHWISEFAPSSIQRPLSYFAGWLCALGWQTAMPAVAYASALQIVALIATSDLSYISEPFHAALLTVAIVVAAVFLKWFAINKLPLIEGVLVILHLFGSFAFVVIFWVMGPRTPADQTFLTFIDGGGWGSLDAAAHLAEEVKDAAYVLPRAMLSSALINYATSIVMVISMVSAVGPNLTDVLKAPSGQPWVLVTLNVTGSKCATIALVVLICFQLCFMAINQVTTSSRQLWAFARDKGLPFHRILSRVNANDGVPRNAVIVTFCSTVVMALTAIGSDVAFNIILSVCNFALVVTYILCIGTPVAKRLRKEQLPTSRFNLGRAGIYINIAALSWLSVLAVFLLFPSRPNPAPVDINWAVLMFGVVLIIAVAWYIMKARHEYDGPVEYVRKDL